MIYFVHFIINFFIIFISLYNFFVIIYHIISYHIIYIIPYHISYHISYHMYIESVTDANFKQRLSYVIHLSCNNQNPRWIYMAKLKKPLRFDTGYDFAFINLNVFAGLIHFGMQSNLLMSREFPLCQLCRRRRQSRYHDNSRFSVPWTPVYIPSCLRACHIEMAP